MNLSAPRRLLRFAFAEGIALLPVALKERLFFSLRRPILGVLFRLERRPVVIARAGPAGHRFPMRLGWQSHTSYVLGIYEHATVRALRRYVRPGSRCVDVGAHLGYFTILMARIAGPSGRVVAFEAFPDTFRTLEENIALNRLENVVIEPRAVSDAPGTISLVFERKQRFSGTPSAVAYAVEGESDVLDVPAVSLDEYFRQRPDLPQLIKIDVEGAEFAVLCGARETLVRARPVLLVEVHGRGGQQFDRVTGFLAECGYRVTVLGTRRGEAFCLALPANGTEEEI